MTRTTYQIGPGLRGAVESPMAFAASVAADAVTQLPMLVSSAWTSLGGFGAMSAPMPATALCLVLLAAGTAAFGLLQIAAAPSPAAAASRRLVFRPGGSGLPAAGAGAPGAARDGRPPPGPLAVPGRRARGACRCDGPGARARPARDAGLAAGRDRRGDGDGAAVAVGDPVARHRRRRGPSTAPTCSCFSTGGLDIDPRRRRIDPSSAWPAARSHGDGACRRCGVRASRCCWGFVPFPKA